MRDDLFRAPARLPTLRDVLCLDAARPRSRRIWFWIAVFLALTLLASPLGERRACADGGLSPSGKTGVAILVALGVGCVAAAGGLAGDLVSRLGPGADPHSALDPGSYHDRLVATAALPAAAAGLFAGAVLWAAFDHADGVAAVASALRRPRPSIFFADRGGGVGLAFSF